MLVDKTVWVTGASSGIGRACAEQFAARGARIILSARRASRLTALSSDLQTETRVVPFDVRDRGAVDAAVEALDPPWSEVDVLVNNAGLAAGFEPLWEGDPDDWERMLDTNVRGLLWMTRAVVAGMVARRRGHVINIGSIAGHQPYANGAVYCATKAAVDRITRALRLELLGTGVKVSTVDPGLVETEFSVVRFGGDADRAEQVYAGMTPLTGDDVAEAVVWVADRPTHVQVTDVVLLAGAQASATAVARDPR